MATIHSIKQVKPWLDNRTILTEQALTDHVNSTCNRSRDAGSPHCSGRLITDWVEPDAPNPVDGCRAAWECSACRKQFVIYWSDAMWNVLTEDGNIRLSDEDPDFGSEDIQFQDIRTAPYMHELSSVSRGEYPFNLYWNDAYYCLLPSGLYPA